MGARARTVSGSDPALAALVGAAALLVWGALGPAEREPVCVDPAELAAFGPHTTTVICGAAAPGPGLRGPARRLFGRGVDLNCSDPGTLETLPGIGPVRAAAIVAERPFGRVEELTRVRGIGPMTLERLRGELVAGPGSAGAPSVPSPGCRSTTRAPR